MRMITFHKTAAGLVCALALSFVSSAVSAQTLYESDKLPPSDGAPGDEFGHSVSISGDVALAGAYRHSETATNAGSAYVFRWNGSAWVQEQELVAADPAELDRFGHSLAVSGNVAVVGANGDDDNGSESGSVYIFRWNGSSWVQEHKHVPPDGAAGDRFGHFVAVSGEFAVIGAYLDDDTGIDSGSAYVLQWDGASWVQDAKLLASDGLSGDEFGISVSVSGEAVIVGALGGEDSSGSGAVYAFRRSGTSWVQEQKLLASDAAADDWFGVCVSMSGNVAVAGASRDDDNGTDSGSAYVWDFNGSSWVQAQKLLPPDGAAGDHFGQYVGISGNIVVVGAPDDDDNGTDSGSAYVFRRNGSSWVCQYKLLPSDGAAGDAFGWSVAVSDRVTLVGALFDDDNGINSGSAYVFDLAPGIPTISHWGLVVVTLLLLAAGTMVLRRQVASPS